MRALHWVFFASAGVLLQCSSTQTPATPPPNDGLQPGEVCDPTNTAELKIRFDPPSIVVAQGSTRPVRALVDPDLCSETKGTFAVADASIAGGPSSAVFNLRHATYDFEVVGNAVGTTEVSLTMQRGIDPAPVVAKLPVEVRSGEVPKCAAGEGTHAGTVDGSNASLSGSGPVATASISSVKTAFARTDEYALPSFGAEVACAGDLTSIAPGKLQALGPAVSFRTTSGLSMTESLRRELDFVIPVNPAAMPPAARMRHVQILFQSPMTTGSGSATKARIVSVANPRFEKSGSDWVMKFSSPWIGTYQAAVASDAGTKRKTKHLTHRAVFGVSMGGGGAASFGMRHHDQFDVIGPLGGPSDWAWLLWYIQTYHTGGFCPASNPGCTLPAPNLYPISGPFVHTQDFNHWYYEKGGGNGGGFDRNEYSQLFWDLAAMRGNPNGTNADPKLAFFPAGPKATDPWVQGDVTGLPPGTDCTVPIDPIKDDPQNALQAQIQHQCYRTRCDPKNALVIPSGYYDDEYNPDGSQQVISFCDGAKDPNAKSPYLNTWIQPDPNSSAIPLNPALAVDLNKNGIRDMNEPVIRQGQEPWSDTGGDGIFSAMEPGYDPITNPDPNGDDYDFVLNPNGSEKNHVYETGEPFQDVGLDGVANTKQQKDGGYDFGEGDGKFTTSAGLANFYSQDPHHLLHRWSEDVPGGPLDDAALGRLDAWVDGGVRDLFNFGAVGNELTGAFSSRVKSDGTRVKPTTFYNNFDMLPGAVAGNINVYQPENVRWADVPEVAMMRYGTVDATPQMIDQGDGQHVGTATQILFRLETSFYFAANRWPDADRTRTLESIENPSATTLNELGVGCELNGRCEKIFTGPKTNRTGPIAVTLPPGYALAENVQRGTRYPVLYVLHGYGQDPRDLEAVAILFNNRVNSGERSYATRLPKFIIVYVDGRCRITNGKPECVRGTFYMNSVRDTGAKLDDWFEEVVQYVDKNYRTLGPSDVDIVE